jgi:hypothetical protein
MSVQAAAAAPTEHRRSTASLNLSSQGIHLTLHSKLATTKDNTYLLQKCNVLPISTVENAMSSRNAMSFLSLPTHTHLFLQCSPLVQNRVLGHEDRRCSHQELGLKPRGRSQLSSITAYLEFT